MSRSRPQRAPRALERSKFEEHSLLAGVLLLLGAVVTAWLGSDPGGVARAIGLTGLGALLLFATSHGVRLYRAGVTASLPVSVARVQVRIRPARGFGVAAVALALALPLGAVVALLASVEAGWMLVAGVLAMSCAGAATARRASGSSDRRPYSWPAGAADGLLARLCMRADMPVPDLVVEADPVASAWTAHGRIHLTRPLVELLDDAELEAVLAHEVAHLARRDAAVMEICSAPSRVLLAFTGTIRPRLLRWLWELADHFAPLAVAVGVVTVFCGPPAFVLGWISRLSVLGMSRARELAADAAAVTLTGRPSALASALMKLDREREWTPRADLRQVEPYAMLCIIGTERSWLGRLLSTHPPTAARIRRLEETEARIQAGPYGSAR